MKITICGSVSSTPRIKEAKETLEKMGHSVAIPFMSEKIIAGAVSLDDFKKEKEKNGDGAFRKLAQSENVDLIKRYYNLISDSDAILVINIDKNGIKNYIGGNVYLEIGFAYVLNKKIFLLNDIPKISYQDELIAMRPIIINGDLSKIE
jgi:hypothetical protein